MKGLSSIGSKLVGVFKSVGATLLNGIASYAISYGISVAVSKLKGLWDELSGAKERRLQKNAIKQMSEDISELKKESDSLDEVTKKFKELKEKANDSTLSIEELLNVKQQLADLQDTLPEKYKQEFDGIDLVNGGLKEQLGLLEEIKEQNAREFLYGESGVMSSEDEHGKTEAQRAYEEVTKKPKNYDYLNNELFSVRGDKGITSINDYYGFDIASILKKAGINYYAGMTKDGEFSYIDDELKDNLPKYDEEVEIQFYLELDEDMTAKEASEALSIIRSEIAKNYGDNQNALDFLDFINGFSTGYNAENDSTAREFLENVARQRMYLEGGKTPEEVALEAKEEYNKALTEYQKNANDVNKEALDEAKKNFNDAKANAEEYINNLTGDEAEIFKVGSESIFNKIWDSKALTSDERIQDYFGSRFLSISNEIIQLSEAEKQALLNILDGIDVENLTQEDIAKAIAQAQKYAAQHPIEIETKVKAVDEIDSAAELRSAVSSLGDIWNQTVLQKTDEGETNGIADSATLQSVYSSFNKFIDEENAKGNDTKELSSALDEYLETLTRFPGDAEKARKAHNKLITAYIDQTNIIKNLTEERKEWAIAELKDIGIENAEAVVLSRLSKSTKELMANVTKLGKSYDKLTNAQKGTAEYEDALNDMAGDVAEMIGLDRNTQNVIDTDFIEKNFDVVKEAATGSAEAVNQLRKEATKEIVPKIHIQGDPTEVLEYRDQINELIDNFDIENINVGANLDDNDMIKGLNNLVDASVITRDQMNSILTGIGVEPVIGKKTAEIKAQENSIAEKVLANGGSTSDAINAIKAFRGTIEVPTISYELKSKGTGAKYSSPSGGGSSSGGGGGGGGSEPTKPKEESEETFDWIEVAIQRIEEEIARLDKVVNNSYDLWGNRNKALVDELEKTTEEIKAQQLAQSEYLRNANLVQVNNGKGLNEDD